MSPVLSEYYHRDVKEWNGTTRDNFMQKVSWRGNEELLRKQTQHLGAKFDVGFWYTCGIILVCLVLVTVLFVCVGTAIYMVRVMAKEWDANKKYYDSRDIRELMAKEALAAASDDKYDNLEFLTTDGKRDFTDIKLNWTSQQRIKELSKANKELEEVDGYQSPKKREVIRTIASPPSPKGTGKYSQIIKADNNWSGDPPGIERDPETGRVYFPFPSADEIKTPNVAAPYTREPHLVQGLVPEDEAVLLGNQPPFEITPPKRPSLPDISLSRPPFKEAKTPKSILKTRRSSSPTVRRSKKSITITTPSRRSRSGSWSSSRSWGSRRSKDSYSSRSRSWDSDRSRSKSSGSGIKVATMGDLGRMSGSDYSGRGTSRTSMSSGDDKAPKTYFLSTSRTDSSTYHTTEELPTSDGSDSNSGSEAAEDFEPPGEDSEAMQYPELSGEGSGTTSPTPNSEPPGEDSEALDYSESQSEFEEAAAEDDKADTNEGSKKGSGSNTSEENYSVATSSSFSDTGSTSSS